MPPATPPTSMLADGRIDELIALTERLTALIAEQAQAFEARRPQDAARDMEETSRLANIYRREAQTLRAQPALVGAASRQDRQRLIRATEAFDELSANAGLDRSVSWAHATRARPRPALRMGNFLPG